MANKYTTLNALFTAIANAIRVKTGKTAAIVADRFPDEVSNIITLKEGSSDATATANTIFKDETAYVDGEKLTGTFDITSEMATQGDIIDQLNDKLDILTGVNLSESEKESF